MAESLGDVIIKLRSQDVNMKSGLDSVRDQLKHLSDHVLSFQGLLHVGFGASAGRAIFHELHHAVMELGQGFEEAQRNGGDFWQSLDTGVAHALGLKSSFEQFIKVQKQAAAQSATTAKLIEQSVGTIATAQGNPLPHMFNDVSNAADADAKFYELRDNRDKAEAAAKEKINAIKQDKFFAQDFENRGDKQSAAFYRQQAANLEADPQVKAYRDAVDALRIFTASMLEADAKAKAGKLADTAKSNLTTLWKDISAPFDKAAGKVAESFIKEHNKAEQEAGKKSKEGLEKTYRTMAETAKKEQEQKKRDAAEAKKFLEAADPLVKLKDEIAEIERLVKTGDLKSSDASKIERQKAEEQAQRDLDRIGHSHFDSADNFSNHLLEKSIDDAYLQQRTNELLGQLVQQGQQQLQRQQNFGGMVA